MVDWWDESREDRLKREEELRPFEEADWWYRITGRSLVKRCHNCPNSDGTYGQWHTREEWKGGDWNKKHDNLKCMECHEHNRGRTYFKSPNFSNQRQCFYMKTRRVKLSDDKLAL